MSKSRPSFREVGESALLDELLGVEPPPQVQALSSHRARWKAGWRPRLNKVQQQAKDDPAIFKVLFSERGTGKTLGATHELVEHCYLNQDALAMVVVREVGQATSGGIWHKLEFEVLPTWKNGNTEPSNIFDPQSKKWVPNPRAGEKTDNGLGINYTPSKLDAQTKKPYIWVENIYGGNSLIILISLPVDEHVTRKVKGKEPSFILGDEAQTWDSIGYFTFLVQQLGRRPKIKSKQRLVLCCNPDGPSHWLYQKFFVEPVNQETGAWDSRYAKYHIPITDNLANLPPNYYEDYVIPAVKGDDIEYRRMVLGEWVDRPDGEALFGSRFLENVHVMPPPEVSKNRNKGMLPVTGHPFIVSYDLGAAHTSLHFLQIVADRNRVMKLVIDEMNFVGDYIKYRDLVPKIIGRMMQWEERMDHKFRWVHISDNSAFNQYRAKDGSYDAWDIEELSKELVAKKSLDERFLIRLLECPKGPHSIEARVRMILDDLEDDCFLVSATCVETKKMLMYLPTEQKNAFKPSEKSPMTHSFDSMTYGFFYYDKRRMRTPLRTAIIKPEVYVMGGR